MLLAEKMNLSNSTLFLVGLVLVLIGLFGLIFCLFSLMIYKKIIDYTYKSSKILDNVDNSPLSRKLIAIFKISRSNKENRDLENTAQIFYRNYYSIFAERFIQLTKENANILDSSSKRTRPTITNFLSARELYKQSQILYLDTREVVANAEQILQLQTISRDWFINTIQDVNNLSKFIRVKTDDEKSWGPNSLSQQYLFDLKQTIENASSSILMGKFNDAILFLKKSNETLQEITKMTDDTEKISYLTDIQLAEKLEELRINISENWLNKNDQNNKTSQLKSLCDIYLSHLKTIKREIYTLNFDKAYEKANEILNQIQKFESNLKYEIMIKEYILGTKSFVTSIFNHLYKEISQMHELIDLNESFGKRSGSVSARLVSINKTINDIENKYKHILNENEIDKIIQQNQQKIDYLKQGKTMKDIYEKSQYSLEQLRVLRNELTTEQDIVKEIESKNNSIKKLLSINEVMIAKNSSISSIKAYKTEIDGLYKILHGSEQQLEDRPEVYKNPSNYEKMVTYLDGKINRLIKIKSEISLQIMVSKLSELSIAYLSRFGGIQSIDNKIKGSLDLMEKEEYFECLNNNVSILNQLQDGNVAIS